MFFQINNTLFGLFSEMLVELWNQRQQFVLIFSGCEQSPLISCALKCGTKVSIDSTVKHI